MTYSLKRPQTPSPITPNPAQTDLANMGGVCARMWAVIENGLLWMLAVTGRQRYRGGAARVRRSARYRAVETVLAFLLVILPGSRAQKKARLEAVYAKARARMNALIRKLLTARERRVWMWGGGYRRAGLGRFASCDFAAGRPRSYDALIPD